MINKKSLAIFLTLIAVCLGIYNYFLRSPSTDPELSSGEKVEVHESSSSRPNQATRIVTDARVPPSLKTTATKKLPKPIEASDQNFEIFDRLERQWLSVAQDVMGDQQYQIYLGMREQNDKEKLKANKEYHDYLRQKYGEKFSYNLSEDQSIREKKINQRYQTELLKMIGPEKFKKYTSLKDQFNEELRKKNQDSLVIEF